MDNPENHRLKGILLNKCPRCGQGDFFITKSAYSRGFDKMNRHCTHCGENLVPEPGFYQGALYMSYAFYVVFMLVYFFVFTFFFSNYYNYFLISIIPVLTLLFPYAYRIARRSWFTVLMKSEPGYRNAEE